MFTKAIRFVEVCLTLKDDSAIDTWHSRRNGTRCWTQNQSGQVNAGRPATAAQRRQLSCGHTATQRAAALVNGGAAIGGRCAPQRVAGALGQHRHTVGDLRANGAHELVGHQRTDVVGLHYTKDWSERKFSIEYLSQMEPSWEM